MYVKGRPNFEQLLALKLAKSLIERRKITPEPNLHRIRDEIRNRDS